VVDYSATYDAYHATAPEDTHTIVFGGKSKLSGLWMDDRTVMAHVARDPARMTLSFGRSHAGRLET
jgi:hypothetical protein